MVLFCRDFSVVLHNMSQAFTVKDDVIVSAPFLVCSELLRTDSLQNSGKLLSGCHGRFAEWPPRAARQRIITLVKYTFLNSEAFEFFSDEVNPHFRTSLFCRKSCYRIVVSCVQLFGTTWSGLQHARPPCPSPSPDVCPSSCPLLQ